MKDFTPTPYTLECVATGREFEDTGWMLADPQCKTPSLVRAKYARRQLEVKPDEYGFYKFCDWLPVRRMLKGSSAPVTYKSKGLARHLGLENLYITFNGYYPAIGATMSTCSFKETEAFSVCARAAEDEERVLVVASAGNTARAFAKVCSDNHIKLLLSVPYDNIEALWFEHPLNPCVKLISCEKGGDYFDAIHLSDIALKGPGFYAEGGAKNIARRDGMATTVLSAVTTIGRIPDYYFQAVGSGTGAIAAWEANMRLIEDGRFGSNTMKLMVSQNAPFVPMYDAWQAGSRKMLAYEDDKARRDAEIIDAKVLSNRRPPYGITGGLYDALKATGGEFFVATNAMARKARKLFKELEGVDIYSASGVALASLVNAVAAGKIEKSSCSTSRAAARSISRRTRSCGTSSRATFSRSNPTRTTWSPRSRRCLRKTLQNSTIHRLSAPSVAAVADWFRGENSPRNFFCRVSSAGVRSRFSGPFSNRQGMRPFPARAFPDAGSCRCGVLPAERRFAAALTAVNADADLTARAAQPAAGSA